MLNAPLDYLIVLRRYSVLKLLAVEQATAYSSYNFQIALK